MITPKYVQHDEKRWKVHKAVTLDEQPAYDLVRYTIVWDAARTKHQIRKLNIVAYADECTPDQREPIRTLKDGGVVLKYNTVRKTVYLRERGRRKGYSTTLAGLLTMCLRQEAANRQREKEFKRRKRITWRTT